MRDFVATVPNHTCELRIQRLQQKRSAGQTMEEEATLEVAYIDGAERFSWPGAKTFRDDALRDLLVMGLSGSGSFAEHLRSVTLSEDTVFGAPEEVRERDTRLLRIPYKVPAGRSGYLVNLDGKEMEAAIQGQITVLLPGMEVLAFTLEAVDLPPDFPVTTVEESIRFSQNPASAGFRPPLEASQRMVENEIDVYTNQVTFGNCREFRGESTLRFDETASQAAPAGTPAATILPPGVPMELRLKSAVVWGKSRTGDTVEAELSRPLKFTGQLLAGEGARVSGRIVEFKRITTAAGISFVVGLQIDAIQQKGATISVGATLDALTDMPKSNRRGIAAAIRGETAPFEVLNRVAPGGRPYPRAGFIRVTGDSSGLPAGLSMRWVSVASD